MARRSRWALGGLAVGAVGIVAAAAWVLAQPERWDAWRAFWVGPDRARFPVHGIDVSHHQGRIDWGRVKASGQAFAFIKATEGADFRDTRFAENWRQARAEGLVTGAYHFFTFCSPGKAQAENFLAVAPRDAGSLPFAVDVEFTGNCVGWESVSRIRAELTAFMDHVRAHVGFEPLLYTTEDVRLELLPVELHEHAYWVRSLWGEPSRTIDWHFWQYSDAGSVPGIRGRVDLNVFAGEPAVWRSRVEATRR